MTDELLLSWTIRGLLFESSSSPRLPFEINDETRWVHVRGEAGATDEGTSQIVGTIQDVTVRRQMEEDLREQQD